MEIDVGKLRKESEKEEREREIINIQKQQANISEKQIKIIEKQTFFTELMALTSAILGITGFIELMNLQNTTFPGGYIKFFLQISSYVILLSLFTILLVIAIIYLYKKTIKSLIENSRVLNSDT